MRRTYRPTCLKLFLLGTAFSGNLITNAYAEEQVSRLDTVTVIATKTEQSTFDVPGMVNTIDTQSAGLQNASTLSDLFLNTPSVQFQGTGRRNGQVPSIRGFSSDSIVVQFDGVRQNFQSGHDGQFFIDPSLIKQVEVVRGASSSLYGSGALGGVIAFQTLQAADLLEPGETSGAEVSASYGSVNTNFTETLKVAGRYQSFDILAGLTKSDSDDIDLGDGNELNSDEDLWSGIVNANWYIDDNQTLSLGFNGYSLDAEEPNNPQVGLDDDVAGDTVDKRTDSYTTRLKYGFENADHLFLNNFSAQAYYTHTKVEETILVDTSLSNVGDVLFRELDTYGINIDNQTYLNTNGFGNHVLSYGAEYYKDEQDGGDTGNADGSGDGVPDAEADTLGFYIQNEITFNELGKVPGELTIIPGLRYDSYESEDTIGNSQDEDQLSPKISVSYKPKPWLMVFGSYSEAFRAPNLTEIYATGTHFSIPTIPPFVLGGVNQFTPNPDLRPETTETLEVGIGLDFDNVIEPNDKVRLKGSRYYIDADDFIDLEVVGAVPGPGCCGTSTNVNIPNAKLDGWDIEMAYETTRWMTSVGYVETDGRDKDTGEFLTNIVPPTFTANLEFRLPEKGLVAGWRSRFAKKLDDVNDADDERAGYGVHDIYAQWKPQSVENLTLNVGVENIFDKNYETVFAGSPEPGVNFKFGATWKF